MVSKGYPLMQLYNRDLIEDVAAKEASLAKARMDLNRKCLLPRKEDLSLQEALVEQALIEFNEVERTYQIAQDLFSKQAMSQGELELKKYAVNLQKAKLNYAKVQLEQIKAGAWQPDIDYAEFEVEYQTALLKNSKQMLEDTLIKAPSDLTVLKINAEAGELAQLNHSDPLMILGDIEECDVEVSIDENEIHRFSPNKEAIGFFRGSSKKPIPLSFVKTKPLLVPKKNLNGSVSEQVDVRVLNVVYQFKDNDKCGYVGQLMDVFISDSQTEQLP
jgi:multidrug resistance efflux pump